MEDIIANGSCLIVISHIVQVHFHSNLLQSWVRICIPLISGVTGGGGGEPRNALGGERLMELVWKNDQVVAQDQNQRSFGKDFTTACGAQPSGWYVGGTSGPSMSNVGKDFATACGAQLFGWNVGGTSSTSTSNVRKDFDTTCGLRMTASPGVSPASGCGVEGTIPPVHKPNLSKEEGKRPNLFNAEGKRRERETNGNNDDDDLVLQMKKHSRKPTSVKRPRAADVHNLSERKRRDRINAKLKALQDLIPRCNKVNKASMLDAAIEYMKSLQLQVQILNNMGGGGMVPMMYPGAQHQYIAAMGMGMEMGAMNQPMMSYPTHGFPLQSAVAGPSFPVLPFPMPQVVVPPTIERTPPVFVQQYPTFISLPVQPGPNQPRLSSPSVVDYYQHLTAPP